MADTIRAYVIYDIEKLFVLDRANGWVDHNRSVSVAHRGDIGQVLQAEESVCQ